MRFACDKTGFPLLMIGDRIISVLPITKIQFERYLTEPGGLSSSWYEKVIAFNPRVSCAEFLNSQREGLFITGVTFEEAEEYAKWVDPHGRIPHEREWREFAQQLKSTPFTGKACEALMGVPMAQTARILFERLIQFVKPTSMADLCLIREGVFEWVASNSEPGGLGAPRTQFFSNTFDPYHDPVLKHFSPDRSRIHGFRILIEGENLP